MQNDVEIISKITVIVVSSPKSVLDIPCLSYNDYE